MATGGTVDPDDLEPGDEMMVEGDWDWDALDPDTRAELYDRIAQALTGDGER